MALYNCPECKKEISEAAKKCPHCGYSLKNGGVIKKVNMKKILIPVGIFILFVTLAAVLYTVLKPTDSEKIIKYIESGEYEKAEEIYLKLADNAAETNEIEKNLISKIAAIYTSYKEEKISAEEATKQITNIKAMSVSDDVIKNANEAATNVHKLSTSHSAYKTGIEFQEKNEFLNANSWFYKVIKEDVNYSEAQKKIEENKIVLSQQHVNTAEDCYKNKDYAKAIVEIGNAIKYVDSPENQGLKEKYENAKTKWENKEKRLRKGDSFKGNGVKVTFKNAELTYKLLPTNRSGYYSYYSAQKNEIFYAMQFRVKNISGRDVSIEDLVSSMSVKYDNKYVYDSFSIYYIDDSGDIEYAYSWDDIEPLRSVTLYAEVDLPEKVKKSKKPIVSDITIAGKEKRYTYR